MNLYTKQKVITAVTHHQHQAIKLKQNINNGNIMTETKPTRTARRGRIFPEIQWTPEQHAQWEIERQEFHQRCQIIFDKVKPELMQTHYNWYITIEPDSGEYYVNQNEMEGAALVREKYPSRKLYSFRINETGVCGTI
jgi:hypothetical protein